MTNEPILARESKQPGHETAAADPTARPRTACFEAVQLVHLFDQLEEPLIQLQDEFEEALLNQALWTSMDLLENTGLKHREVYASLEQNIGSSTTDIESVKQNLRDGRTTLSDWLFQRFKGIAGQVGPHEESQRAFKNLFDGFARLAAAMPEDIAVPLEALHFTAAAGDSLSLRGSKGIKRLVRGIFKLKFERQFNLRQVVRFHLLGTTSRRLLAVADKVGEAEFFLIQRVKGLYEEMDQTYNGFLTILDEGAKSCPDLQERQRILVKIDQINRELEEGFRLVGSEVMGYYREGRLGFEKEIGLCLDDLATAMLKAGTLELSERAYRGAVSAERSLKRIERKMGHWSRYQAGYAGEYTMELEMVRLQNRLRRAVDETVLQINDRVRRQLEEHMAAVEQRLQKSFEFLRAGWQTVDTQEEVRVSVEKERNELTAYLRNEVGKRLEAIRNSAEINQLIDLLRARFSRLADETVESFPVLEQGENAMGPTAFAVEKTELKVAPVRAVVRTYLERHLIPRLGDINGEMIDQVRRAETWIDELWHVISFSLGNVAIELREAGKTSEELVPVSLSRIERSLQGLRGHYDEILKNSDETRQRVVNEVAGTARLLKQLILKESVVEMQRQIDAGGKNLLGPKSRAGEDDKLQTGPAGDSGEYSTDMLAQIRRDDFETAAASERKTVWESAIWDMEENLIERVPFAYRQLFRTSPLEVSEFLTGRSQALGVIERACKRWRQSEFSPVVIIGAQGSGKTSLINCAMEQRLKGIPLVRHRLSREIADEASLVRLLSDLLDLHGDSLSSLESMIRQAHARRIIILEDLHCIYIRAIGGMDLLNQFLAFVDASGDHILWLVSIDQYAWQYLDRVHDISRHFAFRIETGSLSPQELEGAIMARHRVTGYRLRFVELEGDGAENQGALRDQFFKHLSEACGGNVFAAIFYWLRAIERVEEDTLVIASIKEPHLQVLQGLSPKDMLELAMIIEHGGLSVDLYARIFKASTPEALSELNRFAHLGLLNMVGDDHRTSFEVNPVLYHPIAMALKERGIFL
jgi:hypothetical protein